MGKSLVVFWRARTDEIRVNISNDPLFVNDEQCRKGVDLVDEALRGDPQYIHGLAVSSSGELACRYNFTFFSGGSVPIGEWSHLACVYGPTEVRGYVNGVEVLSGPVPGNIWF